MKIAITADSTCDIPKYLIEENNITIIPLRVITGEEEHKEGEITSSELYNYVAENKILPKTSAISDFEYKEVFSKLREEYDAVIHFALSYEISSTGSNAERASKELENVYVIDTRSLSSGSGLLVLSCADKIKAGKPIEIILEEIKEEVNKVQASFLINKLDYLKKGGRCSAVTYMAASLLKLKVHIMLEDGKMIKGGVYTGKYDACLTKYLKDTMEKFPPNFEGRVFVTSSSPMEGIREKFSEEVKATGFKDVIIMDAGATICSHCGPETIGVLYMTK